MRIPKSKLRESLDGLILDADFDGIGELPNFRILERRNPSLDEKDKYHCFQYVFGRGNKVPWGLSFQAWTQVQSFYEEVDSPVHGDLCVYIYNPLSNRANHVAIAINDTMARSKFQAGYIYKHPIVSVPNFYGNEVLFFRKR